MKGGAVSLTLLVLLASAYVPVGNASPVVLHAPINIQSNAGFTAANGVVAGTGTVADPFVIAGWDIRNAMGHGIVIANVSVAFVIRDNVIDAATSGVFISQVTGVGVVRNNQFTLRQTGVTVVGADVTIQENHFIRASGTTTGVSLVKSDSLVVANTFDLVFNGVVVQEGSPTIISNDINAGCFGVQVRLGVDVTIEANVITNTPTGIDVSESTRVDIHANLIVNAKTAINVLITKDVDIAGNTVRASSVAGARIELSSGNFTGNTVIDGAVDAVLVTRSPLLVANNTISNNLGVGLLLSASNPIVQANTLSLNGVGIRLASGDRAVLQANVLVDNTVGLDIPYASRQAVPLMSGNLVNGFNVDGAITASQQVYFYREANVLISGQTRDSGFSAGRFGSLTAQGNVVLYEVDTATIETTLISHANVGVTAVNSFNVVLEGDTILNTQIGVFATVQAVPFQVPACAVSVKNTTINVTIDPPLTIGIDAHACLLNVLGSTIANVDTGIRVDGATWGNVSGNLVLDTRLGLDIVGRGNELTVIANVIVDNRVGARFSSSTAIVLDNRFEANLIAGVQLDSGSLITFAGNDVIANGEGVVDLRACGTLLLGGTCSGVHAEGNLVASNRGDGVRVNATSTFRGDVLVDNDRNGVRAGAATLVHVRADGNGEDGASVNGDIRVRFSNFTGNGRHGLRFQGSGTIESSNFTFNAEAGIRATAVYAIAVNVNASFNQDGLLFDELIPTPPSPPPVGVPPVSVPGLLGLVGVPQQDPMDMHRSVLIHNSRDAIRAGGAIVNATHNWFGGPPRVSVLDTVGAFQNGISPTVRFAPWYEDRAMTTTGPVAGV